MFLKPFSLLHNMFRPMWSSSSASKLLLKFGFLIWMLFVLYSCSYYTAVCIVVLTGRGPYFCMLPGPSLYVFILYRFAVANKLICGEWTFTKQSLFQVQRHGSDGRRPEDGARDQRWHVRGDGVTRDYFQFLNVDLSGPLCFCTVVVSMRRCDWVRVPCLLLSVSVFIES
jgi:hypothetical protein